MELRARLNERNIGYTGKLWNDDDFKGCKMDDFSVQILDSLENNQLDANGKAKANGEVRIFFRMG